MTAIQSKYVSRVQSNCPNYIRISFTLCIKLYVFDKSMIISFGSIFIVVVIGGNGRIVEMLIKHGRNVDEQDLQGNTPLMWAAVGNHLEIVKLLIDGHKANIWAKNSDGDNVWQYLLHHYPEEAKDKYFDVIHFLLLPDNGMYSVRYVWPYQKLRGAQLTGVDSLRI